MKIGICGGSFNPPHLKHKDLVNNILNKKIVEKVIILPTNNKYNKPQLIDLKDRLNMLNLTFKDCDNVEIASMEESNNLDFTIDALNYYKNKHKKSEIFFIMGSDNLKELKKWKDWEIIVDKFKLIIILRNDDVVDDLKLILPSADVTFINGVGNLSSTSIRKSIKKDSPLEEYLDINVIGYIKANNLYID